MLAVLAYRVAAHERALADEVTLARVHDPTHAEVLGCLGAVGLLPDDHVALLGAQHVHRLGAVWRDTERLARGHDRLPDVAGIPRRDVQLVGQLPSEADPTHP